MEFHSCAPTNPDVIIFRVLRKTMSRVGEINHLTWNDVNIKARYVVLYTRKKMKIRRLFDAPQG